MSLKGPRVIGIAALAMALLLATASAQQSSTLVSPRAAAYDATRETICQGTILSYTEDSLLPPIGAHATVQTSSGAVDVHLGPALYLRANDFSLSQGDFVRIIGATISVQNGEIFMARIVQRGQRFIVIRSLRGSLQAIGAVRALPEARRAETTRGSAR